MPRKILITGASTGIGAATAKLLANKDAVIGVHYNSSEDAANKVAEEVKKKGGTPILIQADLSQPGPCEDTMKRFVAEAGGLDVLINNAGGLIERCDVDKLEWEFIDQTFRLNVYSAFYMTRLGICHLRKSDNDPNIVMLGSIATRTGAPTATAYGATKSALHSFTRGVAKELAPEIRVNCIAPGVIDTPFHQKVTSAERMKQVAESTPLGRNGDAEDIAHGIEYVVSPRAKFITGATFDINGGLYMV